MTTKTAEIADGIFRISTFVPGLTPDGFTFNQFLIKAEEPLLFHTGPRGMFPLVSDAVSKITPIDTLRWITFGHVESDECGSMNHWLDAAPKSQVAHGETGVMVSLNDLANRPPRALRDGEVIDLGGRRVRHIDTPHVPHAWESRLLFEETTGTLFCGDLFTHTGDRPALTNTDIVEPAKAAEEMFHSSSISPLTAPTIRKLADLSPKTLAPMHGSSFNGDTVRALNRLADLYEGWLQEATGVRHARIA
jgi:flavorubredoxin